MNKFNIALLHYTCPPIVGGVEEIVRQQAELFQRYFHNVKVFTGAGDQFAPEVAVEINPLLGSRNKQVLNAHNQLLRGETQGMENIAHRLHRYLQETLAGFDVLIAHNVLTMPYNLPLTYALFRLAQEGTLPIISWNHDSPYFYPDYPSYLNHAPWTVLRRMNSNIYYVVISESRKKQFAELHGTPQHIYVIPNGIDPIRFFRLDKSTIRLIREERLFSADFLMVQPSRLHPRKNVELSIRVVRALQDEGLHAKLLVTGAYDPHETKTLEYYRKLVGLAKQLQVSKDVLILAEYKFKSGQALSADRITIRDLYLIADILFLPSIQEGFGIPLLEAGMIKLPVICSDIPPFNEIGNNNVCYFSINDPPELIARKVIDFTSGLPPTKLFRTVIKNYVWDNIYEDKLLPLITGIVEEHHQQYPETSKGIQQRS